MAVNLTEWGKSVKVAPTRLNLRLLGFGLHSVIYGEPTKSSLKFIRNKIHPKGLQWKSNENTECHVTTCIRSYLGMLLDYKQKIS